MVKVHYYEFPQDLYVRICLLSGGDKKVEIYRRLESKDGELVHMKRAGLIWLGSKGKLDLEDIAKRLRDESSWDAHS